MAGLFLDPVGAVASSKSETCPAILSRCAAAEAVTASSIQLKSSERSRPRKSNAPALIRLSSILRLATRESNRAQKSSSVANGAVAVAVGCGRLCFLRAAAVSARGYSFRRKLQAALVDVRR